MIERIFSILSLGMRNEIKAEKVHIAACLAAKSNMLSTEFERPGHMPWRTIIAARLKIKTNNNENSPARQCTVGRIKLDHIASCQPAGPLATPSLSLLLAALRGGRGKPLPPPPLSPRHSGSVTRGYGHSAWRTVARPLGTSH